MIGKLEAVLALAIPVIENDRIKAKAQEVLDEVDQAYNKSAKRFMRGGDRGSGKGLESQPIDEATQLRSAVEEFFGDIEFR